MKLTLFSRFLMEFLAMVLFKRRDCKNNYQRHIPGNSHAKGWNLLISIKYISLSLSNGTLTNSMWYHDCMIVLPKSWFLAEHMKNVATAFIVLTHWLKERKINYHLNNHIFFSLGNSLFFKNYRHEATRPCPACHSRPHPRQYILMSGNFMMSKKFDYVKNSFSAR